MKRHLHAIFFGYFCYKCIYIYAYIYIDTVISMLGNAETETYQIGHRLFPALGRCSYMDCFAESSRIWTGTQWELASFSG